MNASFLFFLLKKQKRIHEFTLFTDALYNEHRFSALLSSGDSYRLKELCMNGF